MRAYDGFRRGYVLAGGAIFVGLWLGLWKLLDLEDLSDVRRYERYADQVLAGQMPYRDFAVEYPPGALGIFLAPRLATSIVSYDVAFQILLALCGLSLTALILGQLHRYGEPPRALAAAAALTALAPFVLRHAGLERFDLWPAALAAAGIVLLVVERFRLGAIVLGLAAAVKLYPLVIVPLALLHVRRRRGSREAARVAAVIGGVILVCFAPFLLFARHELVESAVRQAERPLQLESLGSSLLLATSLVTRLDVETEVSYGSVNVVAGGSDVLAALSTLALVVAVAAIWIVFGRSAFSKRRLIVASAAAVAAILVFSKVLSPQFLLWPAALVALIDRCPRSVLVLMAAAGLATGILYPAAYESLARAEGAPVILLLARNLLLLLLFASLVRVLVSPEDDSTPRR